MTNAGKVIHWCRMAEEAGRIVRLGEPLAKCWKLLRSVQNGRVWQFPDGSVMCVLDGAIWERGACC